MLLIMWQFWKNPNDFHHNLIICPCRPVIIEVPHFASLRGKEREIVILRSDNGDTWREHTIEATEEAIHQALNGSFEGEGDYNCQHGQHHWHAVFYPPPGFVSLAPPLILRVEVFSLRLVQVWVATCGPEPSSQIFTFFRHRSLKNMKKRVAGTPWKIHKYTDSVMKPFQNGIHDKMVSFHYMINHYVINDLFWLNLHEVITKFYSLMMILCECSWFQYALPANLLLDTSV